MGSVCRKHSIINATYYQWNSNYAGVSANEFKRIKDVEKEHGKLKRMYAELARGQRRSGMLYRERCSAGTEESGGHDNCSKPLNLKGQSLQDRVFLAVGVLKMESGLRGQGRASVLRPLAQEVADDWVQDYNEFKLQEFLGDMTQMVFMRRMFVKEISSF